MSAAEKLMALAEEMTALKAQYDPLQAEWDAGEELANSGDLAENQAGMSRMRAVGPQLLTVVLRMEAIETEADAAFEAAQEEFTQQIQPARDLIADIYSDIPPPNDTWEDDVEWYAPETDGAPDALSRRRRKEGELPVDPAADPAAAPTPEQAIAEIDASMAEIEIMIADLEAQYSALDQQRSALIDEAAAAAAAAADPALVENPAAAVA